MGTDSRKEKSEVCLDLDRPSHGRNCKSTWRRFAEFQLTGRTEPANCQNRSLRCLGRDPFPQMSAERKQPTRHQQPPLWFRGGANGHDRSREVLGTSLENMTALSNSYAQCWIWNRISRGPKYWSCVCTERDVSGRTCGRREMAQD